MNDAKFYFFSIVPKLLYLRRQEEENADFSREHYFMFITYFIIRLNVHQ